PIASRAAAKRKWSCSTSSRCSITSDADTRPSVRSVRPNSNDARTKRAWILCKTAQNAVSHRLHTRQCSIREKNEDRKNDVVNLSTRSDQAQPNRHRLYAACIDLVTVG